MSPVVGVTMGTTGTVVVPSATLRAVHAAVLYSAEDVLIQYARALVHSSEAKRVVLVAS